ncbi:MAG: DNA ligase D [Candidatus Dormibacteraeota bacterium]|uniref:DNA ligase (ATP) n=1 Tax=Candidatus Aeolococcus gillhamiae TaxID=3127015 RepID=A0A934JZZ4_9BACT|nr:DNA ligase D [Candidatus Dormibacteraeota bacterium]
MALEEYRRKRDFTKTPEPSGDEPARSRRPRPTAAKPDWGTLPHGQRFCVQQHRATRMHYDFRLEHNGVLLSWPIPRGPTLDPAIKRLAVHTEDHPVDYGDFEGVIPSGYGAGTVLLWDIGTYEWLRETADDVEKSLAKGDLKFRLSGTKLQGEFALVKIGDRGRRYGGSSDGDKNWLLIKKRDDAVVEKYEASEHEVSVKTGRSLAEIAADGGGDPREAARARRAASTPAQATAAPRAPAQPAARPAPVTADKEERLPAPMLATTVDRPFSREGWFFELKWDGVRALAAVDDGRVRLVGRSGRDETSRYPELAALGRALRGHSAVVDGEIVVMNDDGRPSFERLQSRINVARDTDVRRAMRDSPATYVVFDILRLDGRDLMQTSLRIRKKTLKDVLTPVEAVMYADDVERDGESFFAAVKSRGIEGMIGKRADSPYQPGRRSPDWVKVKAWQTQSCVIAGSTGGRGRRSEHLGALILGVYDGADLIHCGQVGTGFNEKTLRELRARLDMLVVPTSALRPPPRTAEPATWARPELVCEVRHAGWTRQGILRHPAYLGLRDDIAPRDCVREEPAQADAAEPPTAKPIAVARKRSRAHRPTPGRSDDAATEALLEQLGTLKDSDSLEVEGKRVRVTHLNKVMWPDDQLTKRDLIAHYLRVAPVLLPYLRDRPLSMQMFPDGIDGDHFWRKDKPSHAPEWIESWTYHGEKTKEYIVVNELATLIWVANAASIDLHPWHSRIDAPRQPDWAVFDLDPAEGATFESVITIARLTGVALDHYGLHSVLKTTGQTGLQIYVPIRRGPDYGAVRGWVEGVARAIGRIVPELVSWEWSVKARTGRVRIDYTQNIINKTLNAPYTVRAVPRAPVSAPITWAELDDPALRPDRWTVRTIGERLAQTGDLFAGALAGDQVLPPLD